MSVSGLAKARLSKAPRQSSTAATAPFALRGCEVQFHRCVAKKHPANPAVQYTMIHVIHRCRLVPSTSSCSAAATRR